MVPHSAISDYCYRLIVAVEGVYSLAQSKRLLVATGKLAQSYSQEKNSNYEPEGMYLLPYMVIG